MSHQLNSVVLFSFLWLLWIEQLYELVESWLVKSSTVQFSPFFCNCANREHNEALQAFLDKELIHQNIHLNAENAGCRDIYISISISFTIINAFKDVKSNVIHSASFMSVKIITMNEVFIDKYIHRLVCLFYCTTSTSLLKHTANSECFLILW